MAAPKRFLYQVSLGSKVGVWRVGTRVTGTAEGEDGLFMASATAVARAHKDSASGKVTDALKDKVRAKLREMIDAGRIGDPDLYVEEEDPNEAP